MTVISYQRWPWAPVTTPLYAALNCQWAAKALYPQPRAFEQQQTPYLDLMKALLEKGANPNARLTKKVWYAQYDFDQSGVDEIGQENAVARCHLRAELVSRMPSVGADCERIAGIGRKPHLLRFLQRAVGELLMEDGADVRD